MKAQVVERLEKSRVTKGVFASKPEDGHNGAFMLVGPSSRMLQVIASDKEGWDHVSVIVFGSRGKNLPTWTEMEWVKRLFWDDEEIVLEIHPPKSQYVNFHKGCLHLWRKQGEPFYLPPLALV